MGIPYPARAWARPSVGSRGEANANATATASATRLESRSSFAVRRLRLIECRDLERAMDRSDGRGGRVGWERE